MDDLQRETEFVPLSEQRDSAARGGGGGFQDLRPRTAGAIVDEACEFLRDRLVLCVLVLVLPWLAVRLFNYWLVLEYVDPALGNLQQGPQAAAILSQLLGYVVTGITFVFCTMLVAGMAEAWVTGQPSRPGRVMLSVAKRLHVALLLSLMIGFVTGLGQMLLGCLPISVGFFFLFWKLSVAGPVMVVERAGFGKALRRSWNLTTGSVVRCFLVALLAYVLAYLLRTGAELQNQPVIRLWLQETLGHDFRLVDVTLALVSAAFLSIASAVSGAVWAFYYFDCRSRREGLDLMVRLEALEARTVTRGAAE